MLFKITEHPPETMIAYKESDVIEPPEKNPAEQQFMQQFPKTCGYVKEDHPDENDEDFLEDEAELVKGRVIQFTSCSYITGYFTDLQIVWVLFPLCILLLGTMHMLRQQKVWFVVGG